MLVHQKQMHPRCVPFSWVKHDMICAQFWYYYLTIYTPIIARALFLLVVKWDLVQDMICGGSHPDGFELSKYGGGNNWKP